jgi:hypothetical protein
MPHKKEMIQQKKLITLPIKVSHEEYADLQRAKLDSDNPMASNSEWYRSVLLMAIAKNKA